MAMEAGGIEQELATPVPQSQVEYLAELRGRVHDLREDHALPDDDSQIMLARRIQAGDAAAARELVRMNRPLIGFVVGDYAGDRAGESQLLIEAAKSLIESARRYNPYRHGTFAEHASMGIIASLQDEIPWSEGLDPADEQKSTAQMVGLLRGIAVRRKEEPAEEWVPTIREEVAADSPVTDTELPEELSGNSAAVRSKPKRASGPAETNSLTPFRRTGKVPAQRVKAWIEGLNKGDPEAREKIIRWLLPYVLHRAGKQDQSRYDFDDLVQAAALELVREVDRFDTAKGSDVRAVAYTRINGAMIDHIRTEERSRGVSRVVAPAEGAEELTPEEQEALDKKNAAKRTSKIAFSLNDADVWFDPESDTDVEAEVIERNNDSPLKKRIEAALQLLPPQQRETIELRHGLNGKEEHATWRELGEVFGISESGALLKYKTAASNLEKEVQADGDINRLKGHSKPKHLSVRTAQWKLLDKLGELLDTPLNPDEIETVLTCLPGWKYKTGLYKGSVYTALTREVYEIPQDVKVTVESPRKYFGSHTSPTDKSLVLFVRGELLPRDVLEVLEADLQL